MPVNPQDLSEIVRQLSYLRAGGGRKTAGQDFSDFLRSAGGALTETAGGIGKGLELRKIVKGQTPISRLVPGISPEYSNLSVEQAKDLSPFIKAIRGVPDISISPQQQQILGTTESKMSPSQLKADVSIAGLQQKQTVSGNKENLAKSIVKGIKNGDIPPTFEGMGFSGVIPFVEKELADEGINLKKLQMDWLAHKTLTKTMNQNQMVQLQTAFNSTKNDLQPMRQLNEEFNRVGFTPANKLIVKADLSGISLNPSATQNMDENQIAVATKFITQLNLMRDNMAVAFMRGGVPTDQAFRLTENILNPIYGSNQLDAALDQVEVNLNLRQSAVGEISPYVPEKKQTLQKPKFNQPKPSSSKNYNNAGAVKAAVARGEIRKEEAINLLKSKFGYK